MAYQANEPGQTNMVVSLYTCMLYPIWTLIKWNIAFWNQCCPSKDPIQKNSLKAQQHNIALNGYSTPWLSATKCHWGSLHLKVLARSLSSGEERDVELLWPGLSSESVRGAAAEYDCVIWIGVCWEGACVLVTQISWDTFYEFQNDCIRSKW